MAHIDPPRVAADADRLDHLVLARVDDRNDREVAVGHIEVATVDRGGGDVDALDFPQILGRIELRDRGSAVLLVSAELEEVTALADRLLVIREGKIVGEVDPKTATFEEIGLLMTGGD